MNHLSDEQLIEHYFGEDIHRVVSETHLRVCSRCERVYEEISNTLDVRAPEPPAREPRYGERVWRSIQAQLPRYPAKPKRSYISMPRLVLAGLCLLGLLAAFLGGTLWERSRTHPTEAGNSSQAKERVVLFILDDHLDRSERLLVQLNHAGTENGDPDSSLQAEARQLLPDNRLYRQAVSGGRDPIMVAALDHLERVLLEVANSPDRLNSAEIARIEQEMNTDSLLFQIRVLRSRASRQEPKAESSRKGASI
jgi:hypothetical protein